MNAVGDTYVSFAVLALAASPDGQLVAASTDKSRVIVFRAFSEQQLRNLYGASVEEYDVPTVAFSLDQHFLYATSSLPQTAARPGTDEPPMCGQIVVFQLCTGAPVLKLPCHEKPVRSFQRHPLTEALVTGSFDRAVKHWG